MRQTGTSEYQTMWRLDVLKWTNPFLNLVFCFCPTEMEPRKQRTNYCSNSKWINCSSWGSSSSDAADMAQHYFSSLNSSSSWRRGSLWDVTVFFCPAAKTKKEKKFIQRGTLSYIPLKDLRKQERKRADSLVSIAIVSAVTWLPRN